MTPEYKERRRLKHLAQNGPGVVLVDNIETGPTPDGLGRWKGGIKKDSTARVLKSRPSQFATRKNTPGKDSGETVERSSDYFKQGNNTPVPAPVVETSKDEPTAE